MNQKPIYLFSISSHPNAVSVPSLTITFLKPQIDFSQYDYLIITSKQVSEALKEYETQLYIEKAALCVSDASAKSYENIGGAILDIGSGYGDNLADKIKKYPKSTRWLYLRAKVVASDFVTLCKEDGYLIDEVVVYESDCSKDILEVADQENAILIFTSPSSLHCYLKTHDLSPNHTIIVIGKTTAKALPKNVKCHISEKTTIDSCMQLAYSLLNLR
ncbi:uroporphyrinogen-III synthase [Sulfurimonas sp.]